MLLTVAAVAPAVAAVVPVVEAGATGAPSAVAGGADRKAATQSDCQSSQASGSDTARALAHL